MQVLLTLLVCLSAQPTVCETVAPAEVHSDTGAPPTFFECLGAPGQDLARAWLAEHPGYVLKRIQCSVGNGRGDLRDRLVSPRA